MFRYTRIKYNYYLDVGDFLSIQFNRMKVYLGRGNASNETIPWPESSSCPFWRDGLLSYPTSGY